MPVAEARLLVQPPMALPLIDEAYRKAMMLPGMHDLNDSDVNTYYLLN